MVAGGGLAGVAAAVMLSACASDVPEGTTSAQSELACHDKITICHHTRSDTNPTVTISISRQAWPAHEQHGDTMGACEPTPPPPQCGNGMAEGSEECDGADLRGSTCETALGSGATGAVACAADCKLVRDQCQLCGNGVREGTEQCDPPASPECLAAPLCAVCGLSICDAQCNLLPCDPGED